MQYFLNHFLFSKDQHVLLWLRVSVTLGWLTILKTAKLGFQLNRVCQIMFSNFEKCSFSNVLIVFQVVFQNMLKNVTFTSVRMKNSTKHSSQNWGRLFYNFDLYKRFLFQFFNSVDLLKCLCIHMHHWMKMRCFELKVRV